MSQTASHQFRAALSHLLVREGRGAQSRLAEQQGIDRGYLNAIVKGRKGGSDAIRSKITKHFRMEYEEMLTLGRRILDGQSESSLGRGKTRRKASSVPDTAEQEELDDIEDDVQSAEPAAISGKILKAVRILESQSVYRDILSSIIDSFHDALMAKDDSRILRKRVSLLEAKLARLENGQVRSPGKMNS